MLVQCLLRNQACVGSCCSFQKSCACASSKYVFKYHVAYSQNVKPLAEFGSKQAVLEDFFGTSQTARHVTRYWDNMLLQKFPKKTETFGAITSDDSSHLRSQIYLS